MHIIYIPHARIVCLILLQALGTNPSRGFISCLIGIKLLGSLHVIAVSRRKEAWRRATVDGGLIFLPQTCIPNIWLTLSSRPFLPFLFTSQPIIATKLYFSWLENCSYVENYLRGRHARDVGVADGFYSSCPPIRQ